MRIILPHGGKKEGSNIHHYILMSAPTYELHIKNKALASTVGSNIEKKSHLNINLDAHPGRGRQL